VNDHQETRDEETAVTKRNLKPRPDATTRIVDDLPPIPSPKRRTMQEWSLLIEQALSNPGRWVCHGPLLRGTADSLKSKFKKLHADLPMEYHVLPSTQNPDHAFLYIRAQF
jgi:hypothetical protein